jgi:hypothetical protein
MLLGFMCLWLLSPLGVLSHELNVDDSGEFSAPLGGLLLTNLESIKYVAQKVAYKMMQFYPGNQTGGIPGLFGDPYYWWEAGAAFGVCKPVVLITYTETHRK